MQSRWYSPRAIACWLLFPLLLTGFPAGAQSPAGIDSIFRKSPAFLPVDEAFRLDVVKESANLVAVYFEIAPEYYLYRHRFSFAIDGTPVEPVAWPAGSPYEDEYFGAVEIYRDEVGFRLPVPESGTGGVLSVGFQGCADAGLCYPPTSRSVNLATGAPVAAASAAQPERTAALPEPETAPELGGLFWFLLAGLGLTFTPCVLPMLPILSSVILGPGRRVSTGRATALTGTYVASMALTFALAGVLVGYFGARLNLQAHLQNPWILGAFAALFVALALAMFDLYPLRMPAALGRLADRGGSEGSLAGAAVMGSISSLVVSPCVSAPLAGALLYIAATGDALFGGLALLALGTGMGIPLLVAGIGGGRFLPRSGPWMVAVKRLFGVLMIGVAIWLLERFLAGPVALTLWAALALFTAAGARVIAESGGPRLRLVATMVAMAGFLLGGLWLAGASTGGADIWRPLENISVSGQKGSSSRDFHDKFSEYRDLDGVQRALSGAAERGQPAFVDVYADWCISCRIMEREVLGSAEVQARLSRLALVRADVTDTGPASTRLLEHFGVFGPPAWIFYDARGNEIRSMRVVGEIDEDDFISLLEAHAGRFAVPTRDLATPGNTDRQQNR